jgi:hypothetical protein
MKKKIVTFDIDEATYIGNAEDGVYYQIAEKHGKWYMTAVVDSNTGSFVDNLIVDDGPYDTEQEALKAGAAVAQEWCIDNNVHLSALDQFSELIFSIKYRRGQDKLDLLLSNPRYAQFLTMEESEVTPEIEQEIYEAIDNLRGKA